MLKYVVSHKRAKKGTNNCFETRYMSKSHAKPKRPQHFSLRISDHREDRLKEFARAPPCIVISATTGTISVTYLLHEYVSMTPALSQPL